METVITVAALLLAAWMGWRLRAARAAARHLSRELAQAQRQESLGTLTGGIAHDFNNILGSIMGFSALLEDDLISLPESRELAHQITLGTRRGQAIVRQLMNYSKRTAAAGQPHEQVLLDPLVRESLDILRPSLHGARDIVYRNVSRVDAVMADATQLGQVLVNLCLNADHAIGIKTGRIEVTLDNEMIAEPIGHEEGIEITGGEEADAPLRLINGRLLPGNYACLSVKDNGSGMTRDIAARIFDPFFTTKEVNVGTGLGLAAVQGIMQSHGGAIIVRSRHFKGTTFSLYLPVSIDGEGHAGHRAERAFQ